MKIPKWIIFNFITNETQNSFEKLPFLNKRLKSMCLDLIYIVGIYIPLIIIDVPLFSYLIKTETLSFFVTLFEYIIIIFSILNKDLCNGKSISKRIFGYQIIDIETNKAASDFKCMLRNLTVVIFPLEVLVVTLNNKRRIGDLIAGTMLIECETEKKETFLTDLREKKKFSPRLLIVSVSAAIIIGLLVNNG